MEERKMEISNEMTKELFEQFVPAAKSAERNTSVYNRMADLFEVQYNELCNDVIGEEFVGTVESDEKTKKEILRFVAISAFISAARSLDLVLTGTGFGIVSTESTAPASAARVNALIADMRVQALLAKERIVEKMIRTEGWGVTTPAAIQIGTLFYRPELMRRKCTLPLTAENWQIARQRALEADAILRDEISPEYMDALLQKLRTASMDNGDNVMLEKCTSFMADFISSYELTGGRRNESMLRQIVEQLESYPSSYPVYTSSPLYQKRHAKRYENKREDPSFFFM